MRTDVLGLGVVLALGGLVYGSSRIAAHATTPAFPAGIAGASLATGSPHSGLEDARGRSLRHPPRPTAAAIARHVREAAARHGLPESLVAAVISVESDSNPRAVSRRGALGLMQLMPSTAASLGVRDAFNPAQNVDGGARHLRDLIDRFAGDLPRALAAYNAGAQAVLRHKGVPPYPETRAFVARVLSRAGAMTLPAAAVAHAGPSASLGAGHASAAGPSSPPPRVQLARPTVESPRSSQDEAAVTPAAVPDGRNAGSASPPAAASAESQVSVTSPPARSEAP
jgi:hypothetical protein